LLIVLGGLALLALALIPYREHVLRLVRARRTARTAPKRATSSARSGEGS
jgi:hypothetical protein